MKLENQVVSLELAKKLKELGVKQNSIFYWLNGVIQTSLIEKEAIGDNIFRGAKNVSYSAFTVAELGEMLPEAFASSRDRMRKYFCWNEMKNISDEGYMKTADTEADARAKMLIYLIENNLITL